MHGDNQGSALSSATEDSLSLATGPEDEKSPAKSGDSSELLSALKKFVLETTGSTVPRPNTPRAPQILGFTLATLDIVLLYFLTPPEWYNNRLFVFMTRLVPWLLGASFFVFSGTIRDWVMLRCGKRWFLVLVGGSLIPLVLTQLPIFSVRARIVPATADVVDAEHVEDQQRGVKFDRKGESVRVFFPGLNPNKVQISDAGSEGSEEFVVAFSRLGILRGTLAQTPLVGRLFAQPVRLTPLYLLPIHASRGSPMVHIEGDFPETFLRAIGMPEAPQSLARCNAHKTKTQHFALDCGFSLDMKEWLHLPPGSYYLTQEWEGCSKTTEEIHLSRENANKIDFDKLPCRK